MAVQARRNIDNRAFYLSGDANVREAETIAQDAGRVAVLETKTVMAKNPATGFWVPLTDVDVQDGPAVAVCGANGANLAAWQAVADGSFQITVNGVAFDITGLDFQLITALDEIADTINSATETDQFEAFYDSGADYVTFVSTIQGVESTITVLTAGTAGTDISGAGFLNGLAATLTQGTGDSGINIPSGIYIGDEITAAALVAGNVAGSPIAVGGNVTVDREQIVIENSLTLADIVAGRNKTIQDVLAEIGIFPESSVEIDGYENT